MSGGTDVHSVFSPLTGSIFREISRQSEVCTLFRVRSSEDTRLARVDTGYSQSFICLFGDRFWTLPWDTKKQKHSRAERNEKIALRYIIVGG